MIKQFNFYKSYAEIITGLNNTEAGQYIKKLCEFIFQDKDFDTQAADKISCFLLLNEEDFRENKIISAENKTGRKERRFAFRSVYANIFFLLKDAEAGILIKKICDYVFGGNSITEEEEKSVSGYFSAMKKSLALSKNQSDKARKDVKDNISTTGISVDSIKKEFKLIGNLRADNPILNNVSLTELHKYIEENFEIKKLAYYKIVEKFREENNLPKV